MLPVRHSETMVQPVYASEFLWIADLPDSRSLNNIFIEMVKYPSGLLKDGL